MFQGNIVRLTLFIYIEKANMLPNNNKKSDQFKSTSQDQSTINAFSKFLAIKINCKKMPLLHAIRIKLLFLDKLLTPLKKQNDILIC